MAQEPQILLKFCPHERSYSKKKYYPGKEGGERSVAKSLGLGVSTTFLLLKQAMGAESSGCVAAC